MSDALAQAAHRNASALATGERTATAGRMIMRAALGVIFLWFGAMKFTSYEATGIAPFVANSPIMSPLHPLLGIQGAADVLGVLEVATGALLLAGFVKPLLSGIGAAMGVLTFAITLTFMLSTPGVAEPLAGGFPALSAVPGQFLLKDLALLGIALFFLGEALWKRSPSGRDSMSPVLGTRADVAPDARLFRLGGWVIRYGTALIFLWVGAMKFTSYEATGIAPFIANSPIVAWWHGLLGIQGASSMLGIVEIAVGLMLMIHRVSPRVSAFGAALAVLTFVITTSFLLTTPGVAAPTGFPVLSGAPGQFLLKDLGLLGIAIYLLGESLVLAASRGRMPASAPVVPDSRSAMRP